MHDGNGASRDSGARAPRLHAAGARRLLAALGEDADEESATHERVGDPEAAAREGDRPGDDASGFSLSGYTMEALLGEGASGRVYRARRDATGLAVAVKVIHRRVGAGHGETPEAQRAWRELDLLAQLRLPCLPRLLDYGVAGGRLYMVTELVDGPPLDRHCAEHEMGRPERVALLADLAEGVQSLHERGVIHRDIKPSNVLVNGHGQPVIIDLGVASMLARDALETLTAEGAPIGSPAFMAPEQARGERDKISTRTDVYALGATALVVLTGRTPHELTGATIHDAIRRVADEPAREPRSIDPSLPKRLAAVIGKALSPRPQDRYASAGEFGEDLRRWLRGEPVEAAPAGPVVRFARWLRRHPVIATGGAAAMVGVVTLAVGQAVVWWAQRRPDHVELVEEGRKARLVSVSGNVLQEWDGGGQTAFRGGWLRDRPGALGGGRVLCLAAAPHASVGFAGRLAVFDVGRLDRPLWTTDRGPPAVPYPRNQVNQDPQRCAVRNVSLFDVFPDRPGDELVVIQEDERHSLCVVQVLDLNGELLSEFWHDGWLTDSHWLPGPGLLVLAGVNSEGIWTDRGEATQRGPHPIVVLALKPPPLQRRVMLATEPESAVLRPAWYRCLLPATASDVFDRVDASDPTEKDLARDHVRVSVSLSDRPGVSLAWVLDEHGDTHHQVVPDIYKLQTDAPEPTQFHWGALPLRSAAHGEQSPITR